MQRYYVNNL